MCTGVAPSPKGSEDNKCRIINSGTQDYMTPHLSPKPRHADCLLVASYNCRSVAAECDLRVLLDSTKRLHYHVLTLQETKAKEEYTKKTADGDLIVIGAKVEKKNVGGVGFIVHRSIEHLVDHSMIYNPRIAKLVLKIRHSKVAIFSCYAPTEMDSESEKDKFYADLEKIVKEEKAYYKVVSGDFNATISGEAGDARVGPHGAEETNGNGDRLKDLMDSVGLFHGNSLFEKPSGSKWTWTSPNGATRKEIDHILVNRRWSIFDVTVIPAFQTGSDHRLIRGKLHLREKMRRKDTHRPAPLILPSYDEEALELAVSSFGWAEDDDPTRDYDELCRGLLSCASIAAIPSARRNERRFDDRTRDLLARRRNIQQDPTASLVDKAVINKLCRIAVKESLQRYKDRKLVDAAEKRASIKRCRRDLVDTRGVTTVLRDPNGRAHTSRAEIEGIAENFYTDLFRSSTPVPRVPTPSQSAPPPILPQEIRHAIRSMKGKTASGPDNISSDLLKAGGDSLFHLLAHRFSRYIVAGKVPTQWKTSRTILLYKKGDRADIKNYRPIALLSQPYKLFTKVLLNRLERQLDEFQPVEQAGFRRGFGCVDHIHAATQLIERMREYKLPLVLCFVDYTKAFDSVELNAVYNSLHAAGVDSEYINILEECNVDTTTKIRLFHRDLVIPIGKGVRQGDTISPKLFTTALQYAMQNLDWDDKGVAIDGRKLSNLRFADDILLVSNTPQEMQSMLDELDKAGQSIGLSINRSKTEVMRNRFADPSPILLNGLALNETEDYVYLGRRISMDPDLQPEISRRRNAAWAAFGAIKDAARLVKDKELRAHLFDSTVLPALCYGAETWADNKTTAMAITRTQRALERALLGHSRRSQWQQGLRSDDMRRESGIRDAAQYISAAKHRWAGHVMRQQDDRWTTRVTTWYPRDVKRTTGRPATRWSDAFKHLNTAHRHWSTIARDRNLWKACAQH